MSGNRANPVKNSAGKDDKNHAVIYRLDDILERQDINLTRGGLILVGLLSGGDYHPAGLPRCGTVIAHGLAKCGLGDSLYQAALTRSPDDLPAYLAEWRNDLRHQLRTNSQGHMGRKCPSLAKSVPDDFPDIDILLSYTSPITSETEGRASNNLKLTWNKEPDLGKLGALCELYFEWGVKDIIVKRFRTVIWPSVAMRILRRAAISIDERPRAEPSPTSSRKHEEGNVAHIRSDMITKYFSSTEPGSPCGDISPHEAFIVKIHSIREHTSTDQIQEYRLEIAPAQLVQLTEAGIKGTRPPIEADEWDDDSEDEGKSKTTTPDPTSHLRVWMPASIVRMVEPGLVDLFERSQEAKRNKKAGKTRVTTSKPKASTTQEEEPFLADEETERPRALNNSKANAGLLEDDVKEQTRTGLKTFFATRKSAKGTKAKRSVNAAEPAVSKIVDKANKLECSRTGLALTAAKSTIYISECEDERVLIPCPSSSEKVGSLEADGLIMEHSSKTSIPKEVRRQPLSDSRSHGTRVTKSSQSNTPASYCNIISDSDSDDNNSPLPLAQRYRPRPFPMSSNGRSLLQADKTSPDDLAGVSKPRETQKKTPNSDLQPSQPTGVPRVPVDHIPPDSKRTICYRSDDEGDNERMYSHPDLPSPAGPKVMAVIEISSDSDTPSMSKMPPLLVAHAKARDKINSFSQTHSRATGLKKTSRGDIIDLT